MLILFIIILFAFIGRYLLNKLPLVGETRNFLKGVSLRGCDAWGCGHFGASRSGGKRTHKGLDIVTTLGSFIKAPFHCRIIREGRPYSSNDYHLIEIEGTAKFKEYTAKIMYCNPVSGYQSNNDFKQGDNIAIAEDISLKYGPRMVTHYHLEIYKNGVLVNPEQFI